ncbi:MAG: class I SAM-dependent methyltransferase, partial [Methanothrix sp.]|nr:class I SAM-dependent methyltransferase [Methanothrix sp.]
MGSSSGERQCQQFENGNSGLVERFFKMTNPLFNSQICHHLRAMLRPTPESAEEMRESKLFNSWWYYSAELFPGVIKPGIYPESLPMLPRMLLRNCDLTDSDCLDVGSMEGLLPVLMRKQGARSVVATDFNFYCYQKMLALKAAHRVNFYFKRIGTLYDLSMKISTRALRGYDLINLSGVLYHVVSPLHVLAGVRPLLKKGGLMIVSTNVINRDDYSMEFNNSGKLQTEPNLFWYLSVP